MTGNKGLFCLVQVLVGIQAKIPQVSILGPLLFLLYVNDIVEGIYSFSRLFADDTSLYSVVDNPIQTAERLNLDLAKIHGFAGKWLVTYNTVKLESILLSRKYNTPYHPPVWINQTQIAEVNLISTLVSSFQIIALGMDTKA